MLSSFIEVLYILYIFRGLIDSYFYMLTSLVSLYNSGYVILAEFVKLFSLNLNMKVLCPNNQQIKKY